MVTNRADHRSTPFTSTGAAVRAWAASDERDAEPPGFEDCVADPLDGRGAGEA